MDNIRFIKKTDNEFSSVQMIRTTVFTNEQGANANEEFDSYDHIADFALLFDNDKAVATARAVKTEDGFKIGRIAVLKDYRGKGYGDLIVRAVIEKAFSYGADYVLVDSQNHAVPFYEKIGFSVIGEQIIDRGIAHIPMRIERTDYYGK